MTKTEAVAPKGMPLGSERMDEQALYQRIKMLEGALSQMLDRVADLTDRVRTLEMGKGM